MKSNYGAADWSLYSWKRSSSEREKSAHDLLHEVFKLHKKRTSWCEMIWPQGHSYGRISWKLCSGRFLVVQRERRDGYLRQQNALHPGGSS